MKKNMAVLDRFIRLVIAIVLIVYAFKGMVPAPWNYLMPLIAAAFILTAFTGSCPLYRLLHINTRQFKEAS